MRVNPKTEEEVQEDGLLPAGIYDFEVTDAEDTTSKKGNDMVVLKLTISDADGRDRIVVDYLLEAIAYKLRHFASAVGLLKEYESGNLPAHLMKGRTGQCKLRIKPAQDDFRAKNEVSDYIKAANGTVQQAAPVKSFEKELDDEIPF